MSFLLISSPTIFGSATVDGGIIDYMKRIIEGIIK